MNNWKLWTSLLFAFFLGLSVGGLGAGFFIKQSIKQFTHAGQTKTKNIIMRKLSHDLNLTQAQRAKVEPIVSEALKDIAQIQQAQKPKIDAVIENSVAQIKTQITPAQEKKLDIFVQKLQRRQARRLKRLLEPEALSEGQPSKGQQIKN
jgi:hypothetical protein